MRSSSPIIARYVPGPAIPDLAAVMPRTWASYTIAARLGPARRSRRRPGCGASDGAEPDVATPGVLAAMRLCDGGNTTSDADGSRSTFDESNRPPVPSATSPYTVPAGTSPDQWSPSGDSARRSTSVLPSSLKRTSVTDVAAGACTRTGNAGIGPARYRWTRRR